MSSIREPDHERLLDYPRARIAFDILVERKADSRILGSLLMLRAIFGDVKSELPWLPPRRVADSASAAMRSLARQIRGLDRYGATRSGFAQAATPKNIDLREGLRIDMARLSEFLVAYAQTVDTVSSKRQPRRRARVDNGAICRLVDYVKNTTGKNHYPEVAFLLNAADYFIRKCKQERWQSNILRQLLYRERLRRRKAKRPKGIVKLVLPGA